MRSFLGASRSPDNWGVLAERLRRAADVVLREKQTAPLYEEGSRPSSSRWLGAVHMMLLGQAVESAVKGLLVAQDPTWVDGSRPKTPFRWWRRGHDLVYLLQQAGIMVSAGEERVACLLQDCVEWGGRYPSPMNLRTGRTLAWDEGAIAFAESLYDRLDAARRLLSAGSDGGGVPAQ